jgi:hypothetical protein
MRVTKSRKRLAEIGSAFAIEIDGGFLVGLVTHADPQMGSLCWIARPTFDHVPTADEVDAIAEWRWPVWFLAHTAIRRKLAASIGIVSVPDNLATMPTMRGGDRVIGWVAFRRIDGTDKLLGPTTDRDLPISQMPNVAALKSMVERDWHQRDVL